MSLLELGSVLLLTADVAIFALVIALGLLKQQSILAPLSVWVGANISVLLILAFCAAVIHWSDRKRSPNDKTVA